MKDMLYSCVLPLLTSARSGRFILVVCLLAQWFMVVVTLIHHHFPAVFFGVNYFLPGNPHLFLSFLITDFPPVSQFSLGQLLHLNLLFLCPSSSLCPFPLLRTRSTVGIFSAKEAYILALASVLGFISAGVQGLSL